MRKSDVIIKEGVLEKYRYPGMLVDFNGEEKRYNVGDNINKEDIKCLIERKEYVIIEEKGKIYEYNKI